MPRTRSLAWSQLKIGIVSIVAVVLTVMLILAVGGEGGYFWQRYTLKARFDNIQGLKSGAVVRLSGKEVGSVTDVQFAQDAEIEVTLQVLEDVQSYITSTSVASIGSLGLLGEPIIDISTGAGGTPLAEGAYVKTSGSGGPLGELTTQASTGLEKMQQLLTSIQSGEGTLGKLITDPALYDELQAFVSSAGDVTDAINAGQGTIGGLIKDPAAFESLKTSLANLRTMTDRINNGEGALGRFINDQATGQALSDTMTNMSQVTRRLADGEGTAGKLLTDKELYDRINGMVTRVEAVMATLEKGEGTAGLLLRDRQLYENMNGAVSEIRDLVAEIKKDPRKYLRVNVSIF